MWKKIVLSVIVNFCILQKVVSHPAIGSISSDPNNETPNYEYSVYPESHGESKLCFPAAKTADNSYLPFVEITINSFTPLSQTKKSFDILTQKESFLFIANPSYSEYVRTISRLFRSGLESCAPFAIAFLNIMMTITLFIMYYVDCQYLVDSWNSIKETSENLKGSYKEKSKVVIRWTFITVYHITVLYIIFSCYNYEAKLLEEKSAFYEDKVYLDLNQESKLCLTPQQLADNLSTAITEMKMKIYNAKTFNQADKSVQGFHQGQQSIDILRQWGDSYSMFETNFWKKLATQFIVDEKDTLPKIYLIMFVTILAYTILLCALIKINLISISWLLDRYRKPEEKIDSQVTVTPLLTLESNLKGSETSE